MIPISAQHNEFDIKQQRPVAGETRSFVTGEALFLSPLPVPTGQFPVDLGGKFIEVNDTYLDIGTSNSGKAFQVRIMIANTMFIAFFFFIFAPLLAGTTAWGNPYGVTFWSRAEVVFDYVFYMALGLTGATALIAIYAIAGTTLKKLKTTPVRFNRQRREVCYIPEKSDTPIIRPWEETIAWLSIGTGTTGVGVVKTFTLGIAIEDKANGLAYYINDTVPSPFHGLGQWEAMRSYMEKGPEFCPGKAPYEGRHTFDKERQDMHEEYQHNERSALGVGWWYLTHLITWWRFPYWVAEWDHRFSMKSLPESIAEWSKPLPSEQWAKPSPALNEQNAKIEKAFSQGQDFMTYFKANLSKTEAKESAGSSAL
ncbi:hypothetical protein [Pseudomonas sp. PDM02]|uniref:hypothetical protein n=1 Tax=Pseudomonas sp. PDM02 TaxID=2769267 RepID=UPI001CE16F20|nr:hypothetical protein [Pseudomonas sp. PDM02]